MIKYLKTKSSKINENTFSEKFTDKKILVMGSGPSTDEVNWSNIEYDCVVTTTHFYLNDKVRKLKNITHVTLSEIIDFNHPNFIEFLNTNPDCTLALEPKQGRPFYHTDLWKQFEEKYRDRLIYYNTEIDKFEGAAGRLGFFVMSFNPSDLYYVGIDGYSENFDKQPKNAFRKEFKLDADGYLKAGRRKEFVDSHVNMAKALHEYSKLNGTKLYNLGEGYHYNCSTIYSKEHFPLSQKIKQKING
tara:strand:+ start:2553 stop:3287 length:735 start_codon:yes stop_codon:yes gene_type:complete